MYVYEVKHWLYPILHIINIYVIVLLIDSALCGYMLRNVDSFTLWFITWFHYLLFLYNSFSHGYVGLNDGFNVFDL